MTARSRSGCVSITTACDVGLRTAVRLRCGTARLFVYADWLRTTVEHTSLVQIIERQNIDTTYGAVQRFRFIETTAIDCRKEHLNSTDLDVVAP